MASSSATQLGGQQAVHLHVPLPAAGVQEALRASAHLIKGGSVKTFVLLREDTSWLLTCLEAADFLGAPQLSAAVLRSLEQLPQRPELDLSRVPATLLQPVLTITGNTSLLSEVAYSGILQRAHGDMHEQLAAKILQYRADCDAWSLLTVYGPRSTKELSSLPPELDHWYTIAMNDEHPSSHSPAVRSSPLRAAAAGVTPASSRLWKAALATAHAQHPNQPSQGEVSSTRFSLAFPCATTDAFHHFSAAVGAVWQLLGEAAAATKHGSELQAAHSPHRAWVAEDAAVVRRAMGRLRRVLAAIDAPPPASASAPEPNTTAHTQRAASATASYMAAASARRHHSQSTGAAASISARLAEHRSSKGLPVFRSGGRTRRKPAIHSATPSTAAAVRPFAEAFGGAFTVRSKSLSRRGGDATATAQSSSESTSLHAQVSPAQTARSARSASQPQAHHQRRHPQASTAATRLDTRRQGALRMASTAATRLDTRRQGALGTICRFLLAVSVYRSRRKVRSEWLGSIGVLPVSLSAVHLVGCVPSITPRLPQLWETCSQLQHLCLRGMACVGDVDVESACASLPGLRWLDIACTSASDACMGCVSSLPQLRVLQLGGLKGLTDAGLGVLTAHLAGDRSDARAAVEPPLTPLLLPTGASSRTVLGQRALHCAPLLGLDLSDCRSISNAGVYELGRAALGLLDLSLYGASQLGNDCLLGLGSREHRLRRLNTAGAYKITQAGTHMLFSTASDLELYNDPGDFWGGAEGRAGGHSALHELQPCPSVMDAMHAAPPSPDMRAALYEVSCGRHLCSSEGDPPQGQSAPGEDRGV